MIYTPDLSAGLTESFFQHIERLAQHSSAPMLIKKRLTEISIELLQNIQKHSLELETSRLTIKKSNAHYSIKTINRIAVKEVNVLTDRLDAIKKLEQLELKKLHTKTLRDTTVSAKSGAGLGLYKIAMRSNSKLAYTFQKINNGIYSFSLEINLSAHA